MMSDGVPGLLDAADGDHQQRAGFMHPAGEGRGITPEDRDDRNALRQHGVYLRRHVEG
jgi:hypothetical protein